MQADFHIAELKCHLGPNRIAILIDGPSILATSKTLGFDVDFRRGFSRSSRAAARCELSTKPRSRIRNTHLFDLIDWLDYNGCTIVTKPIKVFIDASGRRKVKAKMHIELTVNAMELAAHVDEMILFSGDGERTWELKQSAARACERACLTGRSARA